MQRQENPQKLPGELQALQDAVWSKVEGGGLTAKVVTSAVAQMGQHLHMGALKHTSMR